MYLPSPPDYREKRLFINPNKRGLYFFGVFSYLLLLIGMTLFATSFFWFIPFVILTGFYLFISYFIGIFGTTFKYKEHRLIRWKNRHYKPSVDVYLPNCGEPIEILDNAMKCVSELDWENLNVYVLDDKGRNAVEALAKKYNFHYMSRPNKGELKKAGNMRYAFPLTKGDLIAVFDADFCPRPDFLRESVPYFNHDEKIGILQTPQYFDIKDDQTWVQKGAGYVQELFYRLIQVNRNTWGASICVGTNAVYRRSALEPFGGTAPIAYSEDLHTGYQLITSGWKVRYIPVNLAKGTCPDTLSSYFVQQYRWCMGSTTLFFNPHFWKTPLPFMVRLNYLSGMFYYLSTGIGTFLIPLPGLFIVWFYPEHVFWYNWLFSIPSMIFGLLYMAYWTQAPFGFYAMRAKIVAYYAHLFALIDKIKNDTMPWVPSGQGKTTRTSNYMKFKEVLFLWSSIYLVASIAGCFYRMHSLLDYNFYPMLFFTLFNYWVSMSIFKEEA